MVGLVPLALAVVIVFGGFYLWARRQGLVSPGPETPERRGHVSLLTEAVAYVGAILVIAGGAAAIAQRWDDIPHWGHVGVFAGGAVLFLGAGLAVRAVPEPAIQRLVGALWFVSAGGVAGAVGLATGEAYRHSAEVTVLAVGLATTAYAAALWAVRRGPLQNVALFAGLVVTLCGVVAVASDRPTPLAFALPLWALGLVWAGAGWRRHLEPVWVSLPLGVVLALVAPSFGAGDHGWLLAVGVLTAAGMMAASVPARNPALLALGTVATFGYVTATVVRYFRHALGVPAALALTGLVILALALVTARLMREVRPAGPKPPTSGGAAPRDLHTVP